MDRATGNDKVHSSVISESATCNEGAKKKKIILRLCLSCGRANDGNKVIAEGNCEDSHCLTPAPMKKAACLSSFTTRGTQTPCLQT